MSEKTFEIGIPVDEDGFLEMECDFCKNRFMIHSDIFKDESYLHFFCPICGLPNQTNTFYCPEILEKAQQIALNYMYEELDRQLGKAMKGFNKNGLVKMSMKVPKKEPEKELYKPANEYEFVQLDCCSSSVKVQYLDKEIGIYCPLCGGSRL